MKIYSKFIALALAATSLASCIDEVTPTEYVTKDQIQQSESALKGMVNSIYTTMTGYENDDGGIECISYGSLLAMLESSTTPMSFNGIGGYNTLGAWAYGSIPGRGERGIYPSYVYYGYIKTVNDIISMIDPETDDATLRGYLGIAYAYRALYYSEFTQIMEYKKPTDPRFTFTQPENDISNLGVPIVTEATTETTNNPRATVDEDFKLVLADLAQAEKYLTGYTRTDKVQPDLGVVYGLYARAYQFLASHTKISTDSEFKNENALWAKAEEYAKKAIETSGCTPLTEDEWTDPTTGFNSRTSQNSWMLATSISESNTYAAHGGAWGSFGFAMLFGTETDFSPYGWRVGRSLDRKMYERLPDTDFRKKSWLGPDFFYKSKNQVDGAKYLVEKDAEGNFINNKYNVGETEDNQSTTQTDWSSDYDGRLSDGAKYRLTSNAAWIRSRINKSLGFKAWPYLYVNIKFRPHNGNYTNEDIGGATDFPMMRVEEMYFIKAEAELHTKDISTAKATLEGLIKTRNQPYTCTATDDAAFIEELAYQKAIEFWGEGRNYFDAKRLELGIHRGYKGTSVERYNCAQDMNGVYVGWTPGWNTGELNTNKALAGYNNPYTNPTTFRSIIFADNAELAKYYGCDLNHPDGE